MAGNFRGSHRAATMSSKKERYSPSSRDSMANASTAASAWNTTTWWEKTRSPRSISFRWICKGTRRRKQIKGLFSFAFIRVHSPPSIGLGLHQGPSALGEHLNAGAASVHEKRAQQEKLLFSERGDSLLELAGRDVRFDSVFEDPLDLLVVYGLGHTVQIVPPPDPACFLIQYSRKAFSRGSASRSLC